MRTYHRKTVSNLGMEVMGRGRQGQGDKMGSGRQGQGDARKNVNKQEKGAEHRESSPLQANRSDFRHPAMIGLPPPSRPWVRLGYQLQDKELSPQIVCHRSTH